MALIIGIDVIVVGILVAIALTKGVERALPFFAFAVTLLPGECQIQLPGLFDLTVQRVATVTLAALYFTMPSSNADAAEKLATPLRGLLLLLLGWNVISTLNSVVFTISLKNVLSNVFDFYLVYYIFAKSLSRVRTVNRILIAFVAALTVCGVVGLLEAYFHWSVITVFPPIAHRFTAGQGGLSGPDGRIQSTFPHTILFANALALGIPWALYLLILAKSRVQKAFLWVSVVLMFWNIYKTMSRGPWLALVLSLVLLLLFSAVKIRKYLLFIAMLSVSVPVIRPGVWETLKNTYLETVDPESARGSSYEYRYTLMRVAKEALAKDTSRAVWGFGPDAFYYLGFEGEDPSSGHTVKFESCDSSVVELMVDTGYIGLLMVIALFVKTMLVSLTAFIRLPKTANLLSLVFLVNLVAYSFMMMSVLNFGWGQQSFMLWILVALSMVYGNLVRSETPVEQSEGSTHSQEFWPAHPTPEAGGVQS